MTPIVLFTYARPDHTEATLNALIRNHRVEETELVVFCDGARSPEAIPKVQETRNRIKSILTQTCPFAAVEVIERRNNLGLTQSIIQGIDSVISKAGRVIVVEDDIVTSPHFLSYHLDALDHYQTHPGVFIVGGWSPPPTIHTIPDDYPHQIYFNPRNPAWGWSIWQDRWEKMDFDVHDYEDLKNSLSLQLAFNRLGDDASQMLYFQQEHGLNTWDIQTTYSLFRNHGLALIPRHSLVDNIGLDNSGEHCGEASHLRTDLSLAQKITSFPEQVYVDDRIMDSFRSIFARPHPSLFGKGAETYWNGARSPKDHADLQMAEKLLQAGQHKQAKQILDLLLVRLPGDPAATTLMAYLAMDLNMTDAALNCFKSALQAYGDYQPAINGYLRLTNQEDL